MQADLNPIAHKHFGLSEYCRVNHASLGIVLNIPQSA